VSKDIYKEIDKMKEHYSALITLIQMQNTIKSKSIETSNKSAEIKLKYKGVDAGSLVKELDSIKEDNKRMEEKLKELQLLRASQLVSSVIQK